MARVSASRNRPNPRREQIQGGSCRTAGGVLVAGQVQAGKPGVVEAGLIPQAEELRVTNPVGFPRPLLGLPLLDEFEEMIDRAN